MTQLTLESAQALFLLIQQTDRVRQAAARDLLREAGRVPTPANLSNETSLENELADLCVCVNRIALQGDVSWENIFGCYERKISEDNPQGELFVC